MRKIAAAKISEVVAKLCIEANIILRHDVLLALKNARSKESNKRARMILDAIIDNAAVARRKKLAICQDTGLPVIFIEIGQGVLITGDLHRAVNKGVESGYKKAFLRNSIIADPILRGASGYQPAVIHTDIVKGNRIKITVLPKGFGCENKSALKMFNPTVNIDQVQRFIVETVKAAGPDACPPYVVGVGIGGSADLACLLAKKALLRSLGSGSARSTITKLERDLLDKINKMKIGPMGLGGKTTCLGVHVQTHPTHIAGLPVAVNISCHALRSASEVI